MGEQRGDKKLSLAPLEFEEALKGLLDTKPPPPADEKPAPARRRPKRADSSKGRE